MAEETESVTITLIITQGPNFHRGMSKESPASLRRGLYHPNTPYPITSLYLLNHSSPNHQNTTLNSPLTLTGVLL